MAFGNPEYKVILQPNFEKSLDKVRKSYYKKNQKEFEKLLEILEGIYDIFSSIPRNKPPLARQMESSISKLEAEGWPKKSVRDGCEFWKLYFRLPGLSGAAQQGRIMYIINEKDKEVGIFWIYNHSQYEKRPPDAEISRVLNDVL